MQDRTYGDLFKLIQSLAGVNQFAPSERDDIANFINRRYFQAYNTSNAWARFLTTNEKRAIATINVEGIINVLPNDYVYELINGPFHQSGWYRSGSDTTLYYPFYTYAGELFSSSTPGATGGVPISGQTTNSGVIIYRASGKWRIGNGGWSINSTTRLANITSGITYWKQSDDDTGDYDTPNKVKLWVPEFTTGGYPDVRAVCTLPTRASSLPSTNAVLPARLPDVAEFVRIYQNPALKINSVHEYDFIQNERGAQLINYQGSKSYTLDSFTDADGNNKTDLDNRNFVYVTYRKPFEKFDVTSDYENSIVRVPSEFFSYLAHSVYSDFLLMDGQSSKALAENDRATQYLTKELERVDIINNNNKATTKFSTYVNTQSR
jgi:hypothetical protein